METDPSRVLLTIIWIINMAIVVGYMLKVRRAGAANPAMQDGLTGGEWILLLITLFLGAALVPGTIYYYGWKKRFPIKARRVLYIEGTYLAIFFLVFLVGGYLVYTYITVPKAQKQAQIMYEQLLQQNPTLNYAHQIGLQAQQAEQENQNANLTSGTTTRVSGAGYSINIPSQWYENKVLEESANDYFVKQWNVFDLTQSVNVSWTNRTDPNAAQVSDETYLLDSANSDSTGKFTLTHPSIVGASKTNMVVSKTGDYWRTALFVHGNGTNLFQVTGVLQHSTPEQISALTQILLSFKLTN